MLFLNQTRRGVTETKRQPLMIKYKSSLNVHFPSQCKNDIFGILFILNGYQKVGKSELIIRKEKTVSKILTNKIGINY